jgi:hypothetical protein
LKVGSVDPVVHHLVQVRDNPLSMNYPGDSGFMDIHRKIAGSSGTQISSCMS